MKSSHVLAICVVTALLLGSSTFTDAAEEGAKVRFDYSNGTYGPANWGNFPGWEKCKTGMMQSPMLITPEIMVTDEDLDEKLRSSHPKRPVPTAISNNGHTIELVVEGLNLKIDGVKYKSAQMHFHYPSEHTIMGYQFPLELHLVHLSEDGKIAVIGWLFTLGKESPFLAQFFDKLPKYVPGEEVKKHELEPIMIPSTKGTYGRYMGSLTTPPCSENVTWSLKLWDFPTVSQEQMNMLAAALPEANARPTQDPYGRMLHISK